MPRIKPVPLSNKSMTDENLIDLDAVETYITSKSSQIKVKIPKARDGDVDKNLNMVYVIFLYLLDAEFPSVVYENLSNSKTFMKLLDRLAEKQKELIQLFLHQHEGGTVCKRWTLWIRYLKDKYEN